MQVDSRAELKPNQPIGGLTAVVKTQGRNLLGPTQSHQNRARIKKQASQHVPRQLQEISVRKQ